MPVADQQQPYDPPPPYNAQEANAPPGPAPITQASAQQGKIL